MSDDQRVADLQAEYAKHLESWDRTRERLTRERALLLWLHAEAVWSREQAIMEEALTWRKLVEQWERTHQDEVLPYTSQLEADIEAARAKVDEVLGWFERERSSRQAWAADADETAQVLERSELMSQRLLHQLDMLIDALYRKWGEDKAKRFIDDVERNNPFKPGPGIDVSEDGVITLAGTPTGVCACLSDEQAAQLGSGFARPVCAVHETGASDA